ncbi:MAG: hypothetical protein H6993_14450 [Pseudomonadales bacterium]|nr:hypothetical protein [Pseudomonadales bacterium]MCP5185161.1 hypothetical protein [Pseudomonadales bacterium]
MTEHHAPESSSTPANDDDARLDARVALIVFACLLAMIVHGVSGWTF